MEAIRKLTRALRDTSDKSCQHRMIKASRTDEHVCGRCGLVEGPSVVSLPPRKEESFARALDLARYDHALGSEIYLTPDKGGISPETLAWMSRVARLRLIPTRERRLFNILSELELLSNFMGLPMGVRRDVRYAVRKLNARMRGYSWRRALAILIYLSCRHRGVPRTPEEIDGAFLTIYGRAPGVDWARMNAGTGLSRAERRMAKLLGVLSDSRE
jgi:transcription initiation factor TFIIIB Brf1 subunit/transcription initiation factor TFIIB